MPNAPAPEEEETPTPVPMAKATTPEPEPEPMDKTPATSKPATDKLTLTPAPEESDASHDGTLALEESDVETPVPVPSTPSPSKPTQGHHYPKKHDPTKARDTRDTSEACQTSALYLPLLLLMMIQRYN